MELWSGEKKATGTPFGSAVTTTNDFSKAFDGNTTTYFDCSQPDSSYTGLQITGWSASAVAGRGWNRAKGSPVSMTANGQRIILDVPITVTGHPVASIYDSRGLLRATLIAKPDGVSRIVFSFNKSRPFAAGRYLVSVKSGNREVIRPFTVTR
jgi:hypothetical protein